MKELLDKISALGGQYHEALNAIDTRRNYWQTHARQLIISAFEESKKATNLRWDIGASNRTKNFESVYLYLLPAPSGVVEETEKLMTSIIREGGQLSYQQAIDGTVMAVVFYPGYSKKNYKNEPSPKIIRHISPLDLTKEMILADVATFLEEVIKWENNAL